MSFCPFCDGGDELVELIFVHRFESDSICRAEDRLGDVFSDDLGDSRCHSFFDPDLSQLVGVLPVRLFLGVSIKVFYVLISQLAMIGSKSDEPLAKWRVGIMALVRFFLSRLHWIMCGITSIKKVLPP